MESTMPQDLTANGILAPEGERFIRFAAERPESTQPFDFKTHEAVPEWFRKYPSSIQPWPCFVSGDRLRELEKVPPALARLLRSVPERFFGEDASRMAEYFGLEEKLVRYMLEQPTGLDRIVARGDFIETTDGMRCIEFNMSARLGGWQAQPVLGLWRDAAWLREFLQDEGIRARYRDPILSLFHHVVEVTRGLGLGLGGELHVLFVMPPEDITEPESILRGLLTHFGTCYERYLESRGDGLGGTLSLVEGAPEEIQVRHDGVYAAGRRIHAIVEYGYELHRQDLYAAFRLGLVQIFNGPSYELVNDKRALALLSEWSDSNLFDREERELIKRYIPWTRRLEEKYVEYRGEREYLPEILEEYREQLVIKQGASFGGQEVAIGYRTPPELWEDLCEQAIDHGGWIVQEWSDSLPLVFAHQERAVPHDVIWGHFAWGDMFGGSFLRMMPRKTAGVINSARGASEGMVLEIPSKDESPASQGRTIHATYF